MFALRLFFTYMTLGIFINMAMTGTLKDIFTDMSLDPVHTISIQILSGSIRPDFRISSRSHPNTFPIHPIKFQDLIRIPSRGIEFPTVCYLIIHFGHRRVSTEIGHEGLSNLVGLLLIFFLYSSDLVLKTRSCSQAEGSCKNRRIRNIPFNFGVFLAI